MSTRGIPVFSNEDVTSMFWYVASLMPNTKVGIGSFIVTTIPVNHSVPNFAYLIEHKDIGKMLFATDLTGFRYWIKGLSHLMIEANYSEDVIVKNALQDKWSSSASKSHLSIEQAIDVIKHNINPSLKTICLLHLSDGNSDEALFKEMVWNETGRRCYIAEPKLIIDLDKEDF